MTRAAADLTAARIARLEARLQKLKQKAAPLRARLAPIDAEIREVEQSLRATLAGQASGRASRPKRRDYELIKRIFAEEHARSGRGARKDTLARLRAAGRKVSESTLSRALREYRQEMKAAQQREPSR
jgi:hypothetical protein